MILIFSDMKWRWLQYVVIISKKNYFEIMLSNFSESSRDFLESLRGYVLEFDPINQLISSCF